MSKPLVYLFGPIAGLSYAEASQGVRRDLAEGLEDSFETLSPMRDKEALRGLPSIQGTYPKELTCSAQAVVMRDLTDVRRADVLVGWKVAGRHFSLGSPFEMGYAAALGKPIILILDPEDELRGHPFIEAVPLLTVVETVDDAVELTYSLFNL